MGLEVQWNIGNVECSRTVTGQIPDWVVSQNFTGNAKRDAEERLAFGHFHDFLERVGECPRSHKGVATRAL